MGTRPGTDFYRRASGIVHHDVGVTTFLVNPRHNAIHALNAVGAAVWEQLAGVTSYVELVETIRLAFPDADPAVVQKDLGELLEQLLAAELAVRCQ